MPFDNGVITEGKLRRLTLISLLRDELPKNFTWDFSHVCSPVGNCKTSGCALGRAIEARLIEREITEFDQYDEIGKLFDMTAEQVNDIFFGGFGGSSSYPRTITGVTNYAEVTPAMVADELEKLP
jgi:hypothetical protein